MVLRRNAVSLIPNFHYVLRRRYTSEVLVDLDKLVESKLNNEEIKPRHQPGIINTNFVKPHPKIIKGLLKSVGDYPVTALINDGLKLNRYIVSRHPPLDKRQYNEKISAIKEEIDSKLDSPDFLAMTEEQLEEYQKKRETKIKKVIKDRTFAWKPITYGRYEGLMYMIGRSSMEYSALLRIMREIAQRDPSFKPKTYFDFGSGIGTGMWAASNFWKDSIFEYTNIDSSRDMNDLSELILQEGNDNAQPFLKSVFYRQFLPGVETTYDLVISAYTLFELPSSNHRKETLLNIWKKCEGYLILVEEGTRNGHQLICEARDYLLSLEDEKQKGHTFAPCSHDFECPRLKEIKNIPCNFETTFELFPFAGKSSIARYSYVVLKKGKRQDTDENWPRIISPTLVRSRHTICRLCTAAGKLQEIIFTNSKHGKWTHRCAKASRWGDRLPVTLKEISHDDSQ